jgi:hypothetical protein
MSNAKQKTKVKDQSDGNLTEELNEFASHTEPQQTTELQRAETQAAHSIIAAESVEDKTYQKQISEAVKSLFHQQENEAFTPTDYETEVPVNSLESAVGYSSLIRQIHHAYVRRVAYYRSKEGGALSIEEARAQAFHACTNEAEAIKEFDLLMSQPLESLNFSDLAKLQSYSPRSAEWFWENAKREGRKEFESGHLAANITFPEEYMKGLWNIARYLGVRESFIDDWQPQGGIEVAMIDMLAQSYFQWQYWLEQTVKRSQTRERELHPKYSEWLERRNSELQANGITEGYWDRPLVTEQQALEHAVQMADRFNRIFMRTLRQLRDLRRYSPVTINNPNQVNIATDGGQQINVSKAEEDFTKVIAK